MNGENQKNQTYNMKVYKHPNNEKCLFNRSVVDQKEKIMKKIIMSLLLAVIVTAGTIAGTAMPGPGKKKVTHNKVTHETKKGLNKTKKGAKEGAYSATHNKATKKMKINKGKESDNRKNM